MYLLKPEFNHQSTVLGLVSTCVAAGDSETAVLGGETLQKEMQDGGYVAWLRRVRDNARATEPKDDAGIEPGHCLLIAEHVRSKGDQNSTLLDETILLDNGDIVVGIAFLRAIPAEDGDGCSSPVGASELTLCLLPSYRDVPSYMLAIQDSLAHIICAGLPCKYIICPVATANGEPVESLLRTALHRCNFMDATSISVNEEVSEHYMFADLRVAQQLKSRIQEWR